jgi:YVTN family beta-propeller protein
MKASLTSAAFVLGALSAAGCTRDGEPMAAAPLPNPRVAFPSEKRTLGYVANQYSDTVSVLDLGSPLTVLGEVPVGINPVEIDGPRQIALDGARGVAYVVLTYPLSVVGAHAVAHGGRPPFGYVRELSLLDLTPLGDTSVDRRAASLALSGDGRQVAVVHFDQDLALLPTDDVESRRANIIVIDPASGLQSGTADKHRGPVCVAPMGVVFGKDRSRAYVACTGEDSLAVVDTATTVVLARVPAGDGPVNKPTAISIDPAGAYVLLSNELTSQVVEHTADDVATTVLSSSELPGIPGPAAFPSPKEWLVPLQSPNGAVRVDAATGNILAQKAYRDDECSNPHAASITDDGRVFVVCEGDHYKVGSVVRLDPMTLEVQERVAVGRYPDQLAIREPILDPILEPSATAAATHP